MGRRLTDEERAYRSISEKAYQASLCDLAERYGWKFRHFHDSRRQVKPGVLVGDKDAAGWPDLVLVRPPEILFVEVKSELGTVEPEQEEWLGYLEACGQEVFVTRPSTQQEIQDRLMRPAVKRIRSAS